MQPNPVSGRGPGHGRRRRPSGLIVGTLLVVLTSLLTCGTPVAAQSSESTDTNTLLIDTLPVTPGTIVTIEGQTAITGPDGSTSFQLDSMSDLSERIKVDGATISGPNDEWRAQFARLYRRDQSHYTVAMDHFHPIEFSFTGTNGEVIAIDRIEELNLKSSIGDELADVDLTSDIWVQSQRVVSTQQGPEVRDIEWSIESAFVESSNIVNRSQVRFFPAEVQHIDVPVLFFSARFKVHDMFFLSPSGDAVELTYPDDRVVVHDLENGELFLESMPRGEYKIVVLGAGPKIARPVVLSRNQEMDLEFLTWLDMSLVGVGLLVFVSLPLLIGVRRRRRKRNALLSADGGDQQVVDKSQPQNPTDAATINRAHDAIGTGDEIDTGNTGNGLANETKAAAAEDDTETSDTLPDIETGEASDHGEGADGEDDGWNDPGFTVRLRMESLAATTIVIDRSQIGVPLDDSKGEDR